MGDRWYFAYGSNLDTEQKECRTGKIREIRRARLYGYRIDFSKLSKDGTGKANLRSDENGVVWGVVYLCNQTALNKMDEKEGVSGGHYFRKDIKVQCDAGEVLDAVTYIAAEKFLRSCLTPTSKYLHKIIRGARIHDLPEKYIEEINRAAQERK